MVGARGLCAALTIWALTLVAVPASAECRQALVLGLDVSGSVDLREYWLQRNGLAEKITTFQKKNIPVQLSNQGTLLF